MTTTKQHDSDCSTNNRGVPELLGPCDCSAAMSNDNLPQQFTKKPVTISAMHFNGTRDSAEALIKWMGSGRYNQSDVVNSTRFPPSLDIVTLEDGHDGRAKHVASVGDWIIQGVQGEFYPCKPDIFAMTYDAGQRDAVAASGACVPDGFVLMPRIPNIAMLVQLIEDNFTVDMSIAKKAQREHGLAVVPPKTEFELAYAKYARLLAAAPTPDRATKAEEAAGESMVPAGFQRLETVKFWAGAFADDPQRVAGAMIVKLLSEYAQLRAMLAAAPVTEAPASKPELPRPATDVERHWEADLGAREAALEEAAQVCRNSINAYVARGRAGEIGHQVSCYILAAIIGIKSATPAAAPVEALTNLVEQARREGWADGMQEAQALLASEIADAGRLDWLETMTVNVREPLRYGSRDMFWATPADDDGESGPSDIRAQLDAAILTKRAGRAA
jgi:hypothetical protein